MTQISFIGLGNMGRPMALNLIRKKYKLNLYDLNSKLLKPFLKTNAKIINNLSDLSNNSNFFITMLPDGKALENLVFKSDGILNKIKKNDILIDCSSVDYDTTIKVYKALSKRGAHFLDAPVSGGVSGAEKATLTIMVGGKKQVFNKAKFILDCLGKNIIYVGNSGSGQIVKACNNMMLGINMIGVCEAFSLANKYGIKNKTFFDICSKSSSSSWAMLNHLPVKGIVDSSAANNNYKPGYAAKLILKDLKIAQGMAKNVSFLATMGKKAHDLYSKFCKRGKENLDYSAIIKYLLRIK